MLSRQKMTYTTFMCAHACGNMIMFHLKDIFFSNETLYSL